jgi:hypothetical protein
MKQTTGTMKISDKQIEELADELKDRTCDFIGEELFELLLEQDIVEETDDFAIVLMNKVMKEFYHPNLTNAWRKSDLEW